MIWPEIRQAYPQQWLIVEALEAHTTPENRRILDRLAVIDTCADGSAAMQRYRELHRQYPSREFYFVHTDREELEIYERRWLGMRAKSEQEEWKAFVDRYAGCLKDVPIERGTQGVYEIRDELR